MTASQFIVFGDYGGSCERTDESVGPYEMDFIGRHAGKARILILLRVSSAEQDVVSLLQITLSTHATSNLYIYFLFYHQRLISGTSSDFTYIHRLGLHSG